MGVYLPLPITEKISHKSENQNEVVTFGVTSMQGWRVSMEDAHAADFFMCGNTKIHYFGVFDGHGGAAVSKWLASVYLKKALTAHFEAVDLNNERQVVTCLEKVFIEADDNLRKDSTLPELRKCHIMAEKYTQEAKRKQQMQQDRVNSSDLTDTDIPDAALDDNGKKYTHDDDMPWNPSQCGSTAVLAVLVPTPSHTRLYVANAGDSRGVLCRKGLAEELSRDHKPNDEDELERISSAGGAVIGGRVDGNLNLSRAIGDLTYKVKGGKPRQQKITAFPETRMVELCKEDTFFVLACDGIWDRMTNDQIVDIINSELDLPTARGQNLMNLCENICNECLVEDPLTSEGKGGDNMTIMIVKLNHSKLELPAEEKTIVTIVGTDDDA